MERKERITILHIAEAPGGVERYLVTLLSKLDNTQFDHILVCSDLYDCEKFKGLVSCVELVSEMHNAISIFNDMKAVLQVRKVIRKYGPDIVYCHSSKAGVIGRIANIGLRSRKGSRSICIYNAHGWSFNMKEVSHGKIKAYVLLEKIFAPLCDKIVCISDYEKKSALRNHICKESKLQVIYNGIDFDEYRENHIVTRAQLGIPESAFVVGTTGRLAKQKAPDVFVRAAAEIKKSIPDTFFVMVGDGIEKEETKRLINAFDLDSSFLITGWVDNPLDYIQNFDVAMLLSRWEGFGLVLPEYMITGKPIVATRVNAIPYVVEDKVNGLLVNMDDYKSAAKSVIRLKEDKELRSRLIMNGKRIVAERFNAERVAREHEKIIHELLKGK